MRESNPATLTVDGLEGLIAEFPESLAVVKSLCLRLRKIFFPLDKDERMRFGTPIGDPSHKPILAFYDDSIGTL